jgi:L-seryl-tRNA(Ser) seleniumtransferase
MDERTDSSSEALRRIPSLDAMLRRARLSEVPRKIAARSCRDYLDDVRRRARAGELSADQIERLFSDGSAEECVLARSAAAEAPRHQRIINATGIVLHTGLGRAPLAAAAQQALQRAAGYAVVEVDPITGVRNEREEAVSALLRGLTGAGAALVVNNNAAAVLLALAAVAAGREVIVSRGELVEIGGGFRMPDVMAQAGCRMVEVGTTNRTHIHDYARAITAETAALLVVHRSNFRMEGFVGSPRRAELAALAHERGLRAIDDLGSGLLIAEELRGLEAEARVASVVADGLDLVCFSGDKLLGGPQCGILLGKPELIARVRAFPLYRALRCDKLTLAALEATLRIYRDGDPCREIPVLRALAAPPDRLERRAAALAEALRAFDPQVVASESFAGSGANPARPLPSFAVAFPGGDALCDALRAPGPLPAVFPRIDAGKVLLDLRTLEGEELDEVARCVAARLRAARGQGH